ncbi:hypothetical protein CVT24_011156 [Panaeolus cyanescens]|uniref:Uncharacterized protein n=1 Tax=Panaeolus cyanescens TaxID=181874 RepID=A0A409YGA7_9AGAR|nr:hypothetical protein CVT24_011156 [Panaeolus cyanescens]
MATVGVVADVAPEPAFASFPPSITSYNITLNLTTILSLIPGSGLFARFRKGIMHQQTVFGVNMNGDDSLSHASESLTSLGEWTTASMSMFEEATASAEAAPAAAAQTAQVPSPWGFFTSGYMIGLFIMAILLHRMQNIVLPSRQPIRRQRHAFRSPPTFAMPFHQRFILRRLYNAVLPLDFSKTSTRLALHLPSIYALSKMLLVWFLLVLQTCEVFPLAPRIQSLLSTDNPWSALVLGPLVSGVEWLERWCIQKDMAQICWSTFCAVCAAFLVEGFIKALNGIGSGFPIGTVNPNTSPFNLIGYAFLLHVYSSPLSHSFHPADGLPSRPDKHTIISITIPLLQQTIFHILSVSKRLSTHRLFPTALTSFLSLVHFHGTIFKLFTGRISDPLTISTASPSHTTAPPFKAEPLTSFTCASSASAAGKIASTVVATAASAASPIPTSVRNGGSMSSSPFNMPNYPLLNLIPNVFETFLIGTILLTVVLNVVVQLLVRGRVERIFSGLNASSGSDEDTQDESPSNPGLWSRVRSFLMSLPLHEDFGVLLLRLGTASLEATGLRGWGNEVAPIRMPIGHMRRLHTAARLFERQETAPEYGTVRMGRVAVGDVQPGYRYEPTDDNSRRIIAIPQYQFGENGQIIRARQSSAVATGPYLSSFASGTSIRRTPVQTTGFMNEVRTIEVGGEGSDNPPSDYDSSEVYDDPARRARRTAMRRAGRGSRQATRRAGGPWRRWLRALWPFVLALWGVARGLMRWFIYTLLERARRAGRGNADRPNHGALVVPSDVGAGQSRDDNKVPAGRSRSVGAWGAQLELMDDEMREVRRKMEEKEVYMKFLRGEDISDDEEYRDEDLQEEEDDDGEDDGTGDEEEGEGDDVMEYENGEEEAFRLFTDILRHGAEETWREGSVPLDNAPSTPSSSRVKSSPRSSNGDVSNGEMVLAHLMHSYSPPNQSQFSSPGPLTRKRWNALVDSTSGARNSRTTDVIPRHRRPQPDYVFESISDTEEPLDLGHPKVVARSMCVICMGSARDIICWPCRYVVCFYFCRDFHD